MCAPRLTAGGALSFPDPAAPERSSRQDPQKNDPMKLHLLAGYGREIATRCRRAHRSGELREHGAVEFLPDAAREIDPLMEKIVRSPDARAAEFRSGNRRVLWVKRR